MVMLVDSGFAQQTEVARAFGKSERSIRRYQERYAQAGMAGLGRPGGWRRGRRRISGKRLRLIERLKSAGLSSRAIAQRLGVSEMAIRKLVGSSTDEEGEQLALVSVPKAPSIEPPLIPPASMICAELLVDPSQAANEIAQESRVLEEEAHGDEPVSMSLDADAGWPATIRFSGRIASVEPSLTIKSSKSAEPVSSAERTAARYGARYYMLALRATHVACQMRSAEN
jgi:transposase